MLEHFRLSGMSALGTIALCLSLAARLAADEPLPTSEDEKPAAAPSRTETEPPKPANPLDQKLKKAIDGGKSEIEQLEQVIEKMRLAGRRIEARDVGAETTKVQKQVIDDLEALLELLKNAQRDKQRQQNPQQNQSNDPNQQKNQNQQSDSKNSSMPDPTSGQSAGNPQSQRSEAEKSRESEERREAARRGAAEEERRQQMIKDVWGHLPPHLREAMLNSFSEKYLPKYEDLVKRYYEALAEKNRNRSAK